MNFNKFKPYIYILPIVIFILLIVGLSIFESIKQSLGIFEHIGLTELTIKYYKNVIFSVEFKDSFIFSFRYSFISSSISLILGTVVAFYIQKYRQNLVLTLLQLGILIPHMIVGVLIFQLISQTGLISKIFYFIGIIDSYDQFPLIVYDKYSMGIIVSFVYKEFAFVAITLYAVLGRISREYVYQSYVLGVNKVKTFLYVTFPMILPNLIYSFIIIFTYSFAAYELPVLMGASYPKAIAVQSYNYYISPDLLDRPYAMVYNTILMLFSFVLFLIFSIFYNKIISKEETYE